MKQCYPLFLLICFFNTAIGQTDSTWLDLGRIKLKKDFTQSITIKAKDLEQMPFTALDEALNVWLYGVATNTATMTYVVNGNLLTDVHAYSIHDIEEITLVQNALVQLNGATQEKQLVLVSTKKNRSAPSGISVAASAFAVTNSFQQQYSGKLDAETNMYHRYDISAWKHSDKLKYGLSASYLHDVISSTSSGWNWHRPLQLNRFRIHGYIDATIDAKNNVWLRAGYIPAVYEKKYQLTFRLSDVTTQKDKESFFTIEGGWNAKPGRYITNELRAAYVPANTHDRYSHEGWFDYPPINYFEHFQSDLKQVFNSLLISDRIGCHIRAGNWSIDPAIDVRYRNIHTSADATSITRNQTADTLVWASKVNSKEDFNMFTITPSVDLSYKNIFNIQGGVVYNATENDRYPKPKRVLPFVTTSVNMLRLISSESDLSWKLFASYAAGGNPGDSIYTMKAVHFNGYSYPTPYKVHLGLMGPGEWFGDDHHNHALQAGSTISAWNGRLQGSYSFEKRWYATRLHGPLSGPDRPNSFNIDVFSIVHRLGITLQPLNGPSFNWLTSLTVSVLKGKAEVAPSRSNTAVWTDLDKGETLWTGGWVNRFQYKRFSAGLDLLYVFNIKDYAGYEWGDNNTISLRNIFAGYQFKWLNVYIQCRNPDQRNESMLPDRREYYGAGIKTTI